MAIQPKFMQISDNPQNSGSQRMHFKLEIEKAEFRPIGKSWDGNTYLSQNWRFYHNESPGTAIIIDGKKYIFTPNKCQIIAPGTLFLTEQKRDVTQLYSHFSVAPTRAISQRGLYEIEYDSILQSLVSNATQNMLKSDPSFFSGKGLSLMSSICSYAISQLPDEIFSPPKIDPRIQQAMTEMEANPHLPHNIESIAQKLGFSRSAFIRLFKIQTGTSPYSLLSDFRMTLAKEKLAFSDEAIESISQATGFRDRFHFSRFFKQRIGISPARYRKGEKTA